jgi:hypothetical protein
MVSFISAKELRSEFDAFGHFYSVKVTPTTVVDCRSVLDIVVKDHVLKDTQSILRRKPDAVFILMNPGSSRPLAEERKSVHAKSFRALPISLVPAKPDATQYQVMRVMHYCDWRHVRVLNLSDLRCAKSGTFFKHFKAAEEEHRFHAHSVFSDRRADELTLKLGGRVPVVRAWGVSDHLRPLIERCQATLTRAKLLRGLLKEGTTNKFLHPLPALQSQKVEWVERMVEQCRG